MATCDSFKVLKDTREQKGWSFAARKPCAGTEVRKLDTGDYSVDGLEGKFVIERKGSVAELASNLFDDRFHRELDRLDAFEHPFVFLEFGPELLGDYPVGSTVPRCKWRFMKVRGPLLLKTYWEARLAHPRIRWEFVGDDGPRMALSLMKRVVELYGSQG